MEDLSTADLTVTNPDNEFFETASEAGKTKRSISDRQRLHLQKARERARQKNTERRELEKKEKERREEEEQEAKLQKMLEDRQGQTKPKQQEPEIIYEREDDDNSEDDDIALFENWMKHMTRYKVFKNERKSKAQPVLEPEPIVEEEPEEEPVITRPPSPQMVRYVMQHGRNKNHRGVRLR